MSWLRLYPTTFSVSRSQAGLDNVKGRLAKDCDNALCNGGSYTTLSDPEARYLSMPSAPVGGVVFQHFGFEFGAHGSGH